MNKRCTVLAWVLVTALLASNLFGSKCMEASCQLAVYNLNSSCCCQKKSPPPSSCCSDHIPQKQEDKKSDDCGCFHAEKENTAVPATTQTASSNYDFQAKIAVQSFVIQSPLKSVSYYFEQPPSQAPPILTTQIRFCKYQV